MIAERRTHRLFLFALLAIALVIPSAARAQITWDSCDSEIPGRCGTLSVPENHSRPDGRRIDVAFAVVPARGTARQPDPVLILLGGPGDAALPRPRGILRAFAAINGTRDLVLVDQRGTGLSSPLGCPFGSDDDLQSYLDAFLPAAAMRRCLDSLRATVDPARYRTRDFIADLEALRVALGVRQWNLDGSSYGTRVAMQYAARHPSSIRTLTLLAPAPPELAMPAPFGEDAERALRLVIADCAKDAGCAQAFPRLASELESVVERLGRAPAAVTVLHPVTGARTRVTLSRSAFGEAVRGVLYNPGETRALPLLIHQAYLGDFGGLAGMALRRQRRLAREGWGGLYLAITCAEDVPRVDRPAVLQESRATILSEGRARDHFAACAGWPGAEPGDWPSSHRFKVPTLILAGEYDPVTPPRWAERAARHAVKSRLVVVPQGGHGFAGMRDAGCVTRIQLAFLDSADPGKLDVSCAAKMARLPFIVSP